MKKLYFRTAPILVLMFFANCEIQSQHNVPLDQWVKDYAEDLSKSDWKEQIVKYVHETNFEEHEKFRDAYQNYYAEVVRSVDNGEDVMAWIKVSAIWKGGLKGDIIENAKIGSKIEWEEVWSFNVIDGKFGDQWSILHDNVQKMKSVGLKCLPD